MKNLYRFNPIVPHKAITMDREIVKEQTVLNTILHSYLKTHKIRNKKGKKKIALTVCDMWDKKAKQYYKVIREITY